MKKDFAKDLLFVPILFLLCSILGVLDVTGMTVHIILAVVGVAVLIVYTILTKKDWKIPALEIIMRVLYGLALISGIVLNVQYVFFLGWVHKLLSVFFSVALLVLFIHKIVANNKKENKDEEK